MLSKGLWWRIGSGLHIHPLYDHWLPCKESFRVYTRSPNTIWNVSELFYNMVSGTMRMLMLIFSLLMWRLLKLFLWETLHKKSIWFGTMRRMSGYLLLNAIIWWVCEISLVKAIAVVNFISGVVRNFEFGHST